MNILFYGNCQLFAVLNTLNLSISNNIFHIECWKDNINQQDFTDIILKCDIIITQPIKNNYRNVEYLSTTYIKSKKKTKLQINII